MVINNPLDLISSMPNKSFSYVVRQDKVNSNYWSFELFNDSLQRILQIRVNAVSGRFYLRKSANVNLKVVSDSIVKFLEILRS